MIKKNNLRCLLSVFVLLVSMPLFAYDITNDGIFYSVKSDGTLEVTGLASWTNRADIPSSITVNGSKYRVTSIGESAFEGRSDITYLSLQYSIKSIGNNAFRDCGSNMTVNIANLEAWCKMELGNEHSSPLSSAKKVLLYDVETASINIPETITSIGKFTFYQCRSITSLNISGSVTSIGSSAFEDCTGLTSVTLSKGLTSIGGSSFEGCKGLTSITIPSTVTSIAINAFKGCTNLNAITSEIQQPFAINDNVFNTYSTATLKVPNGTKWAYQSTAGWNKFSRITEATSGDDDPVISPELPYLTFIAKERGTFSFSGTSYNNVDNSVIYYSLDSGITWSPLARNEQSPIMQAGKKIMFRGSLRPLYSEVNGEEAISGIGGFSSTGRFDVEGNIMSLLYGDNFVGQTDLTGKDHTFFELFLNCTGLISAEKLELPATKLAKNCYEGMFRSCTSLTTAPQLPATTLANSCYEGMFYACTSLTTAPLLPATSLGESCYCYMFGGCTSLMTAPKLPATKLADMCYRSMFRGCTSLTIAPQLPATTLTSKCYEYMFAGCTNLKEMTCLANNISASDCTSNWLSNVALDGTFTKSSSMNSWKRGADGIPTNWTVLNDDGSLINEFTNNGISYKVDNFAMTAEVKFIDSSQRNVNIPESINYNGTEYRVTSLAERSFEGRDDITYLSIPSSITSIGEYAFIDCGSNIKVNITSLEAWCKVKFANQHSSPLSSAKAFYLNDVEVKSLSIPSGVTSISSYAFYQCRSITSLTIPSSVTYISSSAFEDCTGLTSIGLSEGLSSIGGSSFEGCKGITSITIPSTVTSIAINAFNGCTSLNSITSEIKQPFDIEENVFSTYTTATLTVPAGTEAAYRSKKGWYKFINITDGQDVVLTANNYTREYGDSNPVFDYTREGDELIGTPSITCDATATSPVGTYIIRITKGSVENSNVKYVDGTLTITKAPLSVTAKSYSREVEQENPDFEVTYSGFKNGENESVLTIKPTVTTTATASSSPGTYDINVSGAEAQNYSISYNKGVLTVNEKGEISFEIDGATYQGIKSDKKVKVKSVDTELVSIEIPVSISYDGILYQVTGIADDAFKGCNLGALIWNVEAALPMNAFSNSSIGSNFLLYVKSASYAPSSVKNVIVDGIAQSIILSDDGRQFYSPRSFTAQSISYTHNYSMETGGDGMGWETIALPFDVQKVSHSTKGEMVPFASYSTSSNQKPFWLANFSGSSFRRASAIKANEPYIIAMPNNSNYKYEYILAGDVTFSAENVTIPQTPTFNGSFLPTFVAVGKSSTIMALNNARYSGGYDPGSRFISNLRELRPFEAYFTDGATRSILEINFDEDTTDMERIFADTHGDSEFTIYTLGGQLVKRTTLREFDTVWISLQKGVYVVNGKKWIK